MRVPGHDNMTKKEALHELKRIEYERELLRQREIMARYVLSDKRKNRKLKD